LCRWGQNSSGSSCKIHLTALLIHFVLGRSGIGSDVFFLGEITGMAQRNCWIFQLEKYLEIVHHLKNICILFNFITTSLEKKQNGWFQFFEFSSWLVWRNKRNGSLIAVESLYISCRLICVLDEKG
jgi:hypothetical protein